MGRASECLNLKQSIELLQPAVSDTPTLGKDRLVVQACKFTVEVVYVVIVLVVISEEDSYKGQQAETKFASEKPY